MLDFNVHNTHEAFVAVCFSVKNFLDLFTQSKKVRRRLGTKNKLVFGNDNIFFSVECIEAYQKAMI